MTTPALNIPIRVVGSDNFKRTMNDTSAIVRTATLGITKQVIAMNAGWLASQGAAGAATLAFGRVLGVLGPIALGITAVVDSFKLMGYAIDLAKKKIADWNDIADKANASGFSTEFFQRITKSSGEARDKIADLSAALVQFNDASAPKLGGSDLEKRIKELKDAGNLTGNTGVAALSGATNAETRLRAVVSLIDQMMASGQRFAALDLAGRAFGPQITAALRSDADYLNQMLVRANAINQSQIISPEDIGRAIDLKERMEAAQKVLAEKWRPIQDDLASAGMNYHASWVSITEDLAAAVGYATDLYKALKQVPDWFANRIGGASIWTSLTNATTTPESRAASEASLGISSDPREVGMVGANNQLRAALQNHANVTRGMREATDVQSAVRGDTSKNPAKAAGDTNDQFDRASEALEKHTARMQADAAAAGLGASALEELRAKAQLLTAAQQAGLPVNDALIAKINAIAKAAAAAGENLAKAKVAGDIGFGRQTALLSPDDVAIAQKLKGIYGDDVPAALASTEAAALRMNNALKGASDSFQNSISEPLVDFETGAKKAGDAMRDFETAFIRSLLNMVNQTLIVKPILSGISSLFTGGVSLPGFNPIAGVTGHADGGMISGPGTGRSDSIVARVSNGEFIVNAAATNRNLPLLHAINADRIPKFADGGMVGTGAAQIGGGQMINVAPQIAVTVQGSPGQSQADHEAMGATIARQIEPSIRSIVAKELRTQMRPGGILR